MFSLAQTPAPTPSSTPDYYETQRAREMQRNVEGALSRRRSPMPFKDVPRRQRLLQEHFESVYRTPTKAESKLLAPNSADLDRFRQFLRLPGTGIIKLVPDFGCAENTKIVSAGQQCLKYTMPGGGSSYSFRIDNYRIPRLADLTFSGEKFLTTGVFSQGILADIGDVSLENVSLATKGMDFLTAFQPTDDYQRAVKIDRDFLNGIEGGGFLYKRSLPVKINTTYLLRSIAYKGPSYQAFEGITYDEFEFDKRRDIVVAFRIVRRDSDGSVTINWQKLADKKAPSVRWPKKDEKQVKENNFVADK